MGKLGSLVVAVAVTSAPIDGALAAQRSTDSEPELTTWDVAEAEQGIQPAPTTAPPAQPSANTHAPPPPAPSTPGTVAPAPPPPRTAPPPPSAAGQVTSPSATNRVAPATMTPVPKSTGLGLIIGASIAGAAGWGLSAAQIYIVRNRCDADDSISGCVFGARALIATIAVRWAANWAGIGLSAGAGVVRGRYDGARFAVEGSPRRNFTVFAATGGVLLGAGLVGQLTLRTLGLVNLFDVCNDKLEDAVTDGDTNDAEKCYRNRFAGYLAGLQLSSTAIAAGAGMLAYGLHYRRARTSRGAGLHRNLVILPNLSPAQTGLTVSGRF